jgi:pyruvate kinase
MPKVSSTDRMIEVAERRLIEEGVVKRGDIMALIAGTPISVRGTTNLLKLHRVGQP